MGRFESGSVEQVVRYVNDLRRMVEQAPRRIGMGNQCSLPRDGLMDVLNEIEIAIPSAVKQGAAVMAQEKEILDGARREAAEQVRKAREEAQKLVDDAKKQADELLAAARKDSEEAARVKVETRNTAEAEKTRAQREADNLREQGKRDLAAARQQAEGEIAAVRQQGQQIYDDAIKRANADAAAIIQRAGQQAQMAVSQESVYNMAVVAAQEMRDAATRDAAMARHDGIEYAAETLTLADAYLCKLVEDLRKQLQALSELR